MVRISRIAALTVGTLVFALAASPADAQVKPFKVTGGGIAAHGLPLTLDTPAPHNAVGEATELGHYFGSGFFQLDAFTGPLSGDFSSAVPFVFTAANGDELAFDYAGTFQLFPTADGRIVAVFVAEFTPVPELSTGRFARVTGANFVMTAITAPFVLGSTGPTAYTWSGDGTLTFGDGE